MDVSFSSFLSQMGGNPVLLITVALTLGVIFVNGWTDAPNAIATCVTTRCMNVRAAILMSAAFNFLGVFVMTKINSSVASTISNMVDFGGNTHEALIALCAALFSIVVYSVGAARFGIPTSESHALIAGLSGAAIALHGGFAGINGGEWIKVLYGLVLSICWASHSAGPRPGWWSSCAKTWTGGAPRAFSAAHRSRAARLWRSCTAHRTAKSLWAFSCWASFCQRTGQRHQFPDPAVADGIVQCRNGSGHFHRRLPHHQGCGHGYGEAGKYQALPPTWRARPACCFPR